MCEPCLLLLLLSSLKRPGRAGAGRRARLCVSLSASSYASRYGSDLPTSGCATNAQVLANIANTHTGYLDREPGTARSRCPALLATLKRARCALRHALRHMSLELLPRSLQPGRSRPLDRALVPPWLQSRRKGPKGATSAAERGLPIRPSRPATCRPSLHPPPPPYGRLILALAAPPLPALPRRRSLTWRAAGRPCQCRPPRGCPCPRPGSS